MQYVLVKQVLFLNFFFMFDSLCHISDILTALLPMNKNVVKVFFVLKNYQCRRRRWPLTLGRARKHRPAGGYISFSVTSNEQRPVKMVNSLNTQYSTIIYNVLSTYLRFVSKPNLFLKLKKVVHMYTITGMVQLCRLQFFFGYLFTTKKIVPMCKMVETQNHSQ